MLVILFLGCVLYCTILWNRRAKSTQFLGQFNNNPWKNNTGATIHELITSKTDSFTEEEVCTQIILDWTV